MNIQHGQIYQNLDNKEYYYFVLDDESDENGFYDCLVYDIRNHLHVVDREGVILDFYSDYVCLVTYANVPPRVLEAFREYITNQVAFWNKFNLK